MSDNEKLDLYKLHKDQYAASKTKPKLVKIARASYLTVEGAGAPDGNRFQAGGAALYSSAFTIKMTRKKAALGDYKICSLEGLWWSDKRSGDFTDLPKDQWQWKLLIRTPDFVKCTDLKKALDALAAKGKTPAAEVRLEKITEGLCVQMLHVGAYSDERRTIDAMLALAGDEGLTFCGKHHEIYLSDPRRVEPDRLRTILRTPVCKSR